MMLDDNAPQPYWLEVRTGERSWLVLGRFTSKERAALALGRLKKKIDFSGVEIGINKDGGRFHALDWDEDELVTVQDHVEKARKWKEENSNDKPVQG